MASPNSEPQVEPVTIGGEEVKSSGVPKSDDINVVDRDPKNINEHLKSLTFSDIIGEPEPGVFSLDQIWTLSYQTFTGSKLWCYRILSVVCGLPCALWWGICFAFLSFSNIWCYVPCIKCCTIELFCLREVLDLLMKALVAPIFDAIGRCFSSIRVTTVHQPGNVNKLDTVHIA